MNLIFDFDGTLADSLPLAVIIINKYLQKYHWLFGDHPPITAKHLRYIGTKQLLEEFNIKGLRLYIMVIMARTEINKYKDKIKIFPGIDKQLLKLSQNHKLFVVTSNSNNHTLCVLNKDDLAKYFVDINSSISYLGKDKKLLNLMHKYNLDPKQTIYVGDETRDVQAAKKAGIKACAVTWGYENKQRLIKSKPDKIITKPNQLRKFVDTK